MLRSRGWLGHGGRARLQELRTSSRPKTTDDKLVKRAANYALDQAPTNAREFVDRFEMFTSEFDRQRDVYRTAIEDLTTRKVNAGEPEHQAALDAATEKLGAPIQGFKEHFNNAVLDKMTDAHVKTRSNVLQTEVAGRFGAKPVGHPPTEASVVADVRAIRDLQFASESSAIYHPNKHGLPHAHEATTYASDEVSRYLKSANETIQTGRAETPQRSQNGGFSLVFPSQRSAAR